LDPIPNEYEIKLAKQQIEQEAKSVISSELHSNVPPSKKSYLTPTLEHQLSQIARNEPLERGIDLERYSKLHSKDSKGASVLNIERAIVALEYSHFAQENLSLLAEYGKNQWLISNDQLEHDLKRVEERIQNEKREIDTINWERKSKQSESASTLNYLEDRWKDGLKRVLDVNVANLTLESELKRSRQE
jgi:pre-mRNA-splicing factor SPF27